MHLMIEQCNKELLVRTARLITKLQRTAQFKAQDTTAQHNSPVAAGHPFMKCSLVHAAELQPERLEQGIPTISCTAGEKDSRA